MGTTTAQTHVTEKEVSTRAISGGNLSARIWKVTPVTILILKQQYPFHRRGWGRSKPNLRSTRTRKKFSASRERRDSVSNSVSSFFYKKSIGLVEENGIRTTAQVIIDRLECVFLLQHSSSISRKDDVP